MPTPEAPCAATILELETARRVALVEQDFARLDELLAEGLLFTHSAGLIEDKQEYLDKLGKRLSFVAITPAGPERVAFQMAGATAVVSSCLNVHLQVAGESESRRFMTQSTSVWAKDGSAWRQIAYHATRV